MDATAITGYGAVISAAIVFCGSVVLLLAMVLGGRLAYLIGASVTLGFILIMAAVWAFTNPISPLGPVGELPSWQETAIGPEVSNFGYPEGEWEVPSEDDEEQTILASELEGDALDYLEASIEEETEGIEFEDVGDVTVNSDATRLIEEDGTTYGATVLEPADGLEDAPSEVTVVMERDEGNALQPARQTFIVTFVLLVIHLFLLSRAERKVKERPGAEVA